MEGNFLKIFGEYEDKKLGAEYLELVTDLRTVINYGKYSSQVISDAPDWEGTEGETLFRYQVNGTGWYYYQYFWVNSGWSFLRWTSSGNALTVDDNSITTAMIQDNAVNADKIAAGAVTAELSKYDSGWFGPIAASTDYQVTHNLGTTKVIAEVYWASDTAGTEMQAPDMANSGVDTSWLVLHNITTTTADVSTGTNISHINDDGSRTNAATDGYARVIMLALA